jgi:hypothetical protein
LLLVPAIYNGFPLVFPDDNAYLQVSYGHFWSLDRSGFYGLLFKPLLVPTNGVTGFWLAIALQAAVVAAVLIVTARQVLPTANQITIFLTIAATALLTSLPWHAAQLMPDAFTGPLVLLTWLAASRPPTAPGSPFLWLATLLLALTHFSHVAIVGAVAAMTLLVSAVSGTAVRQIAARGVAAIAVIALTFGAHLAVNASHFNRWTVSPLGSWFLFARLNEDGLMQPWLERHCGKDAPPELCAIRHQLPQNSQALLWSERSPLVPHFQGKVGQPEIWHWTDMLGTAVKGALREQPLQFAVISAKATARQFTHFQALDDLCPATCDLPILRGFRPDAAPALMHSRQLRDELPKAEVRALTGTVGWLSLALVIPFLVVSVRRRDQLATGLLSAIVAGLVANAAVGGALSNVNDRYQSRVVWLVPFAELLVAFRWRTENPTRRVVQSSAHSMSK